MLHNLVYRKHGLSKPPNDKEYASSPYIFKIPSSKFGVVVNKAFGKAKYILVDVGERERESYTYCLKTFHCSEPCPTLVMGS